MTSSNDPFLAQPGDAGMRPAQPSAQPSAIPPGTTFEPGPPLDPSWDQAPVDAGYGTMQTSPPQAPAPQAPAYAQYPQAGGQVAYGPRPTKTWMNIVALVTGLVGISLAAVIFGHLGMRAASRGEAEYRGLGLAGLILGYLGLVAGIVTAIAMVWFVAQASTATTTF